VLLFLVTAGAGTARAQQQDSTPPRTVAAPLTAADSLLEARTRNLAAQLRCPVCQGLSLQDSPSELSLQMRDVVRAQIQLGKSDDEVKAYFVERYGEWILMEPKARGFNLLVYVLPFLGLVAGGGILYWAIRRWTVATPGEDASTLINDDPDAEPV
jgi:cytochrome c-type biogenesis protein CcmH